MLRQTASASVVLLVVSGVAMVAWRAVDRHAQASAITDVTPVTRRVAVETAPVSAGRLREMRVSSGSLEAPLQFDVAAKVGGLIEKMHVDLGDSIKRGQVIARIESAEFQHALAQAEAEKAVREAEQTQIEAELVRIQRDHDRLMDLGRRGMVSDTEIDQISASLQSQTAAVALAKARVRQAEAAVQLTRINLDRTSVRASWDGGPEQVRVGQRYQAAGSTVNANAPLVSVVALNPIKAIVSVTEADYTRLRVGQSAQLRLDARPDEAFTATIVRIAPIFQTDSRQARIELEVDNPNGLLRPGMFARVQLVLRESEASTIIPRAAVVQRSGQTLVFTVDEATKNAVQHEVTLGIASGDQVEVLQPNLRGRVIVLGQHLVQNGSPVAVVK